MTERSDEILERFKVSAILSSHVLITQRFGTSTSGVSPLSFLPTHSSMSLNEDNIVAELVSHSAALESVS
jgi:hypothetical protein